MEKKILSVLLHDKESYAKIIPYIEKEDFSDQGWILINQVKHFYEVDPDATKVDKDILINRLAREYPKHADTFSRVVESLEQSPSTRNIVSEYFELKREACGRNLGALLISGGGSTTGAKDLLGKYLKLCDGDGESFGEEFEVYQDFSVDSLVTSVSPENLIHVYPKSLNDTLDGGVPAGTHILIYARPETGKSMFMINMSSKFIENEHKVLYIGNEDPYNMMLMRFINRLSGMTRHEVVANPGEAYARARDKGYGNLSFVPLSPGTCGTVRRLAERCEPDIIIVDQVRNLGTGKKQLPKVEHLEFVTKAMRDLNKEFGTVGISVTQAGDSAEGKLILGMGDIDYSNTGMQAHCDVMLGIGMDANYSAMNRRMISVPKNKVSGNHEPFPVAVDPFLSKVVSI